MHRCTDMISWMHRVDGGSRFAHCAKGVVLVLLGEPGGSNPIFKITHIGFWFWYHFEYNNSCHVIMARENESEREMEWESSFSFCNPIRVLIMSVAKLGGINFS